MQKILPIVNMILSLAAVVIAVIVLLQVSDIKKSFIEQKANEAVDASKIPLLQLEEFTMKDNFIIAVPNSDNSKKANVVLSLGFAIDKENDKATETKEVLTQQGKIIRDKLSNLLSEKNLSYYTDNTKKEELKEELLVAVQELVGNKAIVEVYFANLIVSER